MEYLKIELHEVFVSSLSSSGANGKGGVPEETVTFEYGSSQVRYTPQK